MITQWLMVLGVAALCFSATVVGAAEFSKEQAPPPYENKAEAPSVTIFMYKWREPSAIALSPLAMTPFFTVPTPWRDARIPDGDLAEEGGTLLQGKAPREFGVRVRLSETDTAFVKVLSFRGSPKSRALRSIPYLPQTILDRPGGKAFAAGVKLRF